MKKSKYVIHVLLFPDSAFMIDTTSESSSEQHSNQSFTIKFGSWN